MVNSLKKKDWRSQYIRILDNGPQTDLKIKTPEYDLERSLLRDLNDIGCIRIDFTLDSWSWDGTNLAGRVLSDKFKKELNEESLWGKFKKFLIFLSVWFSGIISAFIIYKLTN